MNSIALSNGLLIDGNGNDPVDNCTVVIENDKITGIGLTKNIKIPGNSKIYDMKGKTILPGFINAHVHSGFNEKNLTDWAYDGITTVRDLSLLKDDINPFAFKIKTNQNPRYSRLVTIGYLLTTALGYPLDFAKPPCIPITNEAEAVEKTEWLLDQGADIIKMIIESMAYFGKEVQVLSEDIIKAVAKTANQHGTIACAHVTCVKDMERALNGNVNDIVHMPADVIPDRLVNKMVENGVYLEPTFELWKNAEKIIGVKSSVTANLKNIIPAGGKIALGTDFDGWPPMVSETGMPLKEINWMLEGGMTPMQIITSSTKNAAHVCNLSQSLGVIETGKVADILVVDGNPLNDLRVLKDDKMVIHNGEIIREFKQDV